MTKKDPHITGEAWKTTDRKAVEAVLRGTRVGESSLSPQRIASLSGVDIGAVRVIIKSMLTARQIINAGTAQQPKYRMRGESSNYVPDRITAGTSKGVYRTNYPIWRPGATDHKALPSRMGAKLIYRNGTVGNAS